MNKETKIICTIFTITLIAVSSMAISMRTPPNGPSHAVPVEFQEAIQNGYHWTTNGPEPGENCIYSDGTWSLCGFPQSHNP